MASPIDDVAQELYALLPSEFTAARNAAAKQTPEVKSFPKPSASAWLVNMLARHERDAVERIIELGDQLRDAQFDRQAATALSKQRRDALRDARTIATALAKRLGGTAAAAALDEVEQTLIAAMSDPDAAAAVLAGTLVKPLTANGLDPVDLAGATALDPPALKKSATKKKTPDLRRAVDEAQSDVTEAEARVAGIDRSLAEAKRSRDALQQEREELAAQLASVDEELADTETQIRDLRREHDVAERERRSGETALERATRRWQAHD